MNKKKGIFIVIMMIISTYCSLDSCVEEENSSQCQTHSIEISGISCFSVEDKDEKYCSPYFDDPKVQKIMKKYLLGLQKETYSYMEHQLDEGKRIFDIEKDLDNQTISVTEKDTYNKGETIRTIDYPAKDFLTSNDIKIIKNGNTCTNHIVQNYLNLTLKSLNKSTCYNVEEFEENKNLMQCGYASYNITYNNKDYVLYNCYRLPDANAESYFKQAYNNFYSSQFFRETVIEVLEEFMKEVGQYLKVKNLKKRELQQPMDYDLTVTVEDKYGNIIVYDKNGNVLDEPTKILNSNHHYNLNIFLFLLNLLLFL